MMFCPEVRIECLIKGTQLVVPANLVDLPQDGLDE